MPKVFCANTECTGCKDYNCIREYISIGENDDCICQDYEDYHDTAEYQTEFFICVKAKGGKIAKAIIKGKIIEYNGVVFYTTDDDRNPDYMTVTDKKTGLKIPFKALKDPEMWKKYLDATKKNKDVQTFPLAEWDTKIREYVIKDDVDNG